MKIENIDSFKIAEAIIKLADSVTPQNAVACTDKAGINVSSLTESMIGVTAGLMEIANAIYTLGEVIDNQAKK